MLFSFSGSTNLPAGKGDKSETTAKITAPRLTCVTMKPLLVRIHCPNYAAATRSEDPYK